MRLAHNLPSRRPSTGEGEDGTESRWGDYGPYPKYTTSPHTRLQQALVCRFPDPLPLWNRKRCDALPSGSWTLRTPPPPSHPPHSILINEPLQPTIWTSTSWHWGQRFCWRSRATSVGGGGAPWTLWMPRAAPRLRDKAYWPPLPGGRLARVPRWSIHRRNYGATISFGTSGNPERLKSKRVCTSDSGRPSLGSLGNAA